MKVTYVDRQSKDELHDLIKGMKIPNKTFEIGQYSSSEYPTEVFAINLLIFDEVGLEIRERRLLGKGLTREELLVMLNLMKEQE
jgi:hypothetical protein